MSAESDKKALDHAIEGAAELRDKATDPDQRVMWITLIAVLVSLIPGYVVLTS